MNVLVLGLRFLGTEKPGGVVVLVSSMGVETMKSRASESTAQQKSVVMYGEVT
jgi:hypothetical protein